MRNTAMPAWDLPNHEIWEIVAFLRHLPSHTLSPLAKIASESGA
jgi:hypothetical protein